MGFFSSLFLPKVPTAHEIAAQKMVLLQSKLTDLTLRLAHKRIIMQEGENVMPFANLQRLSVHEVSALPENSIVTMAGIYRRCLGEGATHEVALKIVNSTRVMPIQWTDVSKFKSIEDYINERLIVELAATDARSPILRFLTPEFVSIGIGETNRIFRELFGY